jgi:excisionase family DNA binding protein
MVSNEKFFRICGVRGASERHDRVDAAARGMPKLFRQKELAEALHVSERCIRNWQERRIIPFTKIGRVVLFDFEKVISALERFERKAGG